MAFIAIMILCDRVYHSFQGPRDRHDCRSHYDHHNYCDCYSRYADARIGYKIAFCGFHYMHCAACIVWIALYRLYFVNLIVKIALSGLHYKDCIMQIAL